MKGAEKNSYTTLKLKGIILQGKLVSSTLKNFEF